MTPSTKPVTRITNALFRDRGMRPVIATIHNDLIEVRLKGLRNVEALPLSVVYGLALRARMAKDKADKAAARKARRKG